MEGGEKGTRNEGKERKVVVKLLNALKVDDGWPELRVELVSSFFQTL